MSAEEHAVARPAARGRAQVSLPGARRAVVIGAGSFGTAVAVLLARAALRTTLQTRTEEQAAELAARRVNERYLPGVELPSHLRIESVRSGVARADYVFLAVPSTNIGSVIERLDAAGLGRRAAVVSLSKGLVTPSGAAPTAVLRASFGATRVACLGGPSHAQETVHEGAGLVAAAFDEALAEALAAIFTRAGVVCELSNDPVGVELAGVAKNAEALAAIFTRAGVVCELSNDPVGVELAGVAKNAAALAAGATEGQGLNAAGAAAGHIFAEVWRFAEAGGARPESFIGLAGAGDLVATALAPMSRNRRAGALLADGVPAAEIPSRVAQAVEALESVPLLAEAIKRAGLAAPVTSGLAQLIGGSLPLDDWVALVRTTVPPRARWLRSRSFWQRLRAFFSRASRGS